MPVFLLGKEPVFPPANMADRDGIVAVGGDLRPERLLKAYAGGIFPWYSEDDPITWWSPDPRLVLLPGDLHVSRSMKKLLKADPFRLTSDSAFARVISRCRDTRAKQPGTWITPGMKAAYNRLHELGYAHSIEVWQEGELVGGLYGLSLGKVFFGESMFSLVPNASKFCFIRLGQRLFEKGFALIDCQVPSPHLKTLGAREIPRAEFLTLLESGLEHETDRGKWRLF